MALDNSAAPLHSFEFLVDKCHAEHSPRKKSGFRSWLWKHAPDAVAALVRLVVGHRIGYGRKQETFLLVTSFRLAHETAVDTVAAYFRDRAQSCVCIANSRMFGTNGAYASVRARIGDTRRILDLRTSGEAAEWCGAHIASTRRRMDRISTVAPPTPYESTSRDETVDETN